MYCHQCGSQMESEWVACPHCGTKTWDGQVEEQREYGAPRRAGWYPNRRQWWVIWITAILGVIGLMNGGEGAVFAFCVTIIGVLLVWRLQRPTGSI